jgi:hypothetical protein
MAPPPRLTLPKFAPRWHPVPGPNGEFEVAWGPRDREQDGQPFLYRDGAHDITFLANIGLDYVRVWSARRASNLIDIDLDADENKVIRNNISFLFLERNYYNASEVLKPGVINNVIFGRAAS